MKLNSNFFFFLIFSLICGILSIYLYFWDKYYLCVGISILSIAFLMAGIATGIDTYNK